MGDCAVIGAGTSGLAVLRALRKHGISVDCFERGSDLAGLWRYGNDNGLSSAYASLRTNVSRERMQYPSFPMPSSYGDFPSHSDMAAYLTAYAEAFGLREHIRFGVTVKRLALQAGGRWSILFDDRSIRSYDAVIVAVGHDWCPQLPHDIARFAGRAIHSHDYRTPEPFAGCRVLVVGAGQSAAEIAVEIARTADATTISVRRGAHVIPRWIGGRPYDASDTEPLNRRPWPLLNLHYAQAVSRELGLVPSSWPVPAHRILEGIPIVSSDLLPAIGRGELAVTPAIEHLAHNHVRFVDGSEKRFDRIVFATGYQISLPFIASNLLSPSGHQLPLYRRITPPTVDGLFFAGFTDAPGGLPPLVETQGEWIAAVLTGDVRLPARGQMWDAIDRAEPRTRERFPRESPTSIRCDPHAYQRLLRSDLDVAQLAAQ